MRNPLSKMVSEMEPSGIRRFFDVASTMDNVISLGVGEPDFDTPWHIREEGIYSLEKGRTFYTSNAGLLPLRQEVAAYLKRRFFLEYNPDEVIVTVGGSEAIDIGFRTMLDPGDEVIIPEPCFVSYVPCVLMAGGVPVRLPLEEKDQFKLTKEKLLSAITEKTKVVVLDKNSSHYDRTEAMAEVDRYVVEKERNLGEKLTITCIGDSITYGTKLLNDVDYKEIVYPNYLGEYLEAENVYTMGVGGMPISRVVKDLNENDWGYYDWNPCMLDLFFDDNVNPTDPDKNNPNEEFYSDQNIERLEQSDVIVVMGGVNDSFQTFDSVKDARTVLGMSEDETPTAEQVQEVFLEKRFGSVGSCKEKTFCGDVDKLMKKLKKCAPDAQIIFFTPFQNTVSNGNDMYPLEEYVDAIKKLGKENDITVVDTYGQDFMNTAGAQVRKKYMPDGVHGNAAGNRLIANHVAAWILRGRE